VLGQSRRSRTEADLGAGLDIPQHLPPEPPDPLKHAVASVGGQAALARQLGVSRQAVQHWKTAPVRHVLRIEELTGVSRHDLRPDVYPREC